MILFLYKLFPSTNGLRLTIYRSVTVGEKPVAVYQRRLLSSESQAGRYEPG